MGTFIGALLGAVVIMMVGKNSRGRDFTGLAAGMFALALIVGMVLAPAITMYEMRGAARMVAFGDDREMAEWSYSLAASIISGLISFAVAAIPGVVLVLASSEKKPPE